MSNGEAACCDEDDDEDDEDDDDDDDDAAEAAWNTVRGFKVATAAVSAGTSLLSTTTTLGSGAIRFRAKSRMGGMLDGVINNLRTDETEDCKRTNRFLHARTISIIC